MNFKGSEGLKQQAQELGQQLKETANGFKGFMDGLKGQLSPEEKADYANYKNTPEGRKQSAIFDKIREGVDEVINNIPKQ